MEVDHPLAVGRHHRSGDRSFVSQLPQLVGLQIAEPKLVLPVQALKAIVDKVTRVWGEHRSFRVDVGVYESRAG